MAFNPNNLSFEDGVRRIQAALPKEALGNSEITTSQDSPYSEAQRKLRVSNVPQSFLKYQLPVFLNKPSQFFVSDGPPGAHVASHSHDEGDGLRYIVEGSIVYDDRELKAGDWMFIPAGKKYEFTVGPRGVKMFYCYACCCA